MSRMPPKAAGRSNIFQTPDHATGYILPFLKPEWTVWECASGQHQIVRVLEGAGHKVVATDILSGFDFMDPLLAASLKFDCIVTNPPYSIKDKWLQRCYDIGKPFALLLPITALGEQGRVSMFKRYGISVLLPPDRTMFISPNGTEDGTWFYTAWFCWGLGPPNQILYV